MKQETKQCQNCKKQFTIEPDDFDFYKKVSVLPPTWCPKCRMIRRMTWRNERSLYKRACDSCAKNIIAMYAPDEPLTVYCRDCWWSDGWEAMEYGREYNFSKPFFAQWKELFAQVPHLNLWKIRINENSEFINYAADNKNCYLAYSIVDSENVLYSYAVDNDKDCLDCLFLKNSELCYENVSGDGNYRSSFLVQCRGCLDSTFLYDCVNCQHCFLSSNLRNKKYVFGNEQCTKEEYKKKLQEFYTGSNKTLENLKNHFHELIENKSLHRFAHIVNSPGSTGDHIENAKNIRNSFEVYDAENVAYCARVGTGAKDACDIYGLIRGELIYESVAPGLGAFHNMFSFLNDASQDVEYSCACYNSSNMFACVGLKNKKYCILNKQYSKDEYEKLVPKIKEHMHKMPYVDKKGREYRYGEFFPTELSPFTYNETIAYQYFLLSKENVIQQGYRWREQETKEYKNIIQANTLPDDIKDVSDDIIKETIGCEHGGSCNEQCTIAFKLTPQELQFYKNIYLPLPRLCPNCRHYQRLKQRNPLRLWHRQCMCDYQVYENTVKHQHHPEGRCLNEFETSYAPDRKEVVYCEKCYQAEVV